MNRTKEPLSVVRGLLKTDDMQYQIVADNLAKQILQCGINYYNNVDEEEAIKIDKAYKLQDYAYSIAIGKLVKDRCRENTAILKKKKKELPPITIKVYDNFIKNEIVQYQALSDSNIHDAIELIKKCTPYLMSIKDELGSTNSYYLKLSTLIVSLALYNVIEEFNSVNNDTFQFDLLMDRERTIRRINYVFKEAWTATLYMDKLDIESKLNEYVIGINQQGILFLNSYLKEVASVFLTEAQEMNIVRIAIQMIEADNKIEYSEISFFKKIRLKLSISMR